MLLRHERYKAADKMATNNTKTSVEIVTATKLRAKIKNNIKCKKTTGIQIQTTDICTSPPQGPLIKALYRQKKSSAFPSTIYHVVRPLVREGHSL